MDNLQSNRFICEGGLDTTRNYLNLSSNKPGSATRLINYEPSIAGGYRRLSGYTYLDDDYPEVGESVCQGKVLGLWIFHNDVTRQTEIYAARRLVASPDEYKIYKYVGLTGWVEVSTGLTHYYTVGADTVNKIRYAIGNDGVQNYLCLVDGVNNALLFDGSTWAFINSGNSGATLSAAGGAQAIDAPTIVSFFSQTLFLGCDVITPATGTVAYSAPNEFYNFDSADGAGQVTSGLFVVDMKPFRENLFLFDYDKIKRVVADETVGFVLKDVTNNMGVVARDCVVEIGGDLIFLGPDGFRPIQGTDKIGDVMLETISKPIHSLLRARTIALSDLNVNSVVIRSKAQFRFLFGDDSTDARDSRGVLGGLRTADQFEGWEFAETLGFRASVLTSQMVYGDEYILSGDYDGNVFRLEQGGTLNGEPMTAVYSTPYLDLGDTQQRKTLHKLVTFIVGEGDDISINVNVNFDWGDTNVHNPSNYDIVVVGSVPEYDSGVKYNDGAVYGGFLFPVAGKRLEGSFFSARITYTTSGVESPYSILGFIIEYHTEGKR